MPAVDRVGDTLADAIPWSVRAAKHCVSEACISNWKMTFSILLVVESLVFGHIVLLLRAFACISASRFISIMRYGSAVAGGIFLSTGLLHVVPEAIALYEQGERPTDPHPPGVSTSPPTSSAHAGHTHGPHGVKFPAVFSIILASFYAMVVVEHVLIATCQRKTVEDEEHRCSYDADRSESLDLELYGHTSMGLATPLAARDKEEQESSEPGLGYLSRPFLSSLVITAGVGAHSLLEAITLGAATKFPDVLNLFLAIAAHRWATSAALGIRYAKAKLATGPVVLLVFLFSFIAPIGVGFGFLTVDANPKVQGVFFALGAGTLLYLGAAATLEHDMWRKSAPLRMYIASAVGAASMLVVTAILVRYELH